jgi:glycosyltransferase involved in cell wall biosynthesis
MPAISVIVPVYKVEKYIHRCVDSILGQTFTDFELILVDDGSPDSCGAICDEYAAKDSRVVIHQENGGLSAARNAGIEWSFDHSNSGWMTFIDSDDWVHPQYLELLHRACLENGTALRSVSMLQRRSVVLNTVTIRTIR